MTTGEVTLPVTSDAVGVDPAVVSVWIVTGSLTSMDVPDVAVVVVPLIETLKVSLIPVVETEVEIGLVLQLKRNVSHRFDRCVYTCQAASAYAPLYGTGMRYGKTAIRTWV